MKRGLVQRVFDQRVGWIGVTLILENKAWCSLSVYNPFQLAVQLFSPSMEGGGLDTLQNSWRLNASFVRGTSRGGPEFSKVIAGPGPRAPLRTGRHGSLTF